jgi:porphobilinogen synthase
MPFPTHRPRRLRATPAIRALVRETHLSPSDLIAPLFVQRGAAREPIASMPGQFRLGVEEAARETHELYNLGVAGVILFGIVPGEEKTPDGRAAFDPKGPVSLAIEAIKSRVPEAIVMADVCACEYTSHGHCGLLSEGRHGVGVDNDSTLEILGAASTCYARAGADIIAPSDMMDGRVAHIRRALDAAQFVDVPILSYAAKFAGAFYGPFRDAADSTPTFGDRRSYQMDIANRREAMREMALDVEEGADMLMVKPALFCLDLIREARERFDLPLAAYNVSSEYSMIKAAGAAGWIDEARLINETLLSIKRAGADIILTYHAREWAERFGK